jgi:cobalamin biosynthesis protein CobW
MTSTGKIQATIVTGFLGAGKTTLVRHVLEHAGGRRIAIIVNEFGEIGIDGNTLKACAVPGCTEDDIIELANGCLCCTVADEFLPVMEALLARAEPPEHILIETSGLALPKPLIKAFNWPSIRSRVTVDGVITLVDGPAVAAGRFADDPEAVARQRAEDPSVDHDNPLAEVYEDQLFAADMVVLNKADLLDDAGLSRVRAQIAAMTPRAVKVVTAREGRIDVAVLLGLAAAAEDDLAARKSHHDAEDGAHEHDDFESFSIALPECDSPEALLAALRPVAEAHDILRMKGFAAVRGRPSRLELQGVGARFRHQYGAAWNDAERRGCLVVIGQTGLDRAAIAASVAGALARPVQAV